MKKIKTPIIDVKKYGGKQVAIMDGQIIATGRNLKEVLQKAKRIAPSRPLSEISIFAVPQTLSVIYYVS